MIKTIFESSFIPFSLIWRKFVASSAYGITTFSTYKPLLFFQKSAEFSQIFSAYNRPI